MKLDDLRFLLDYFDYSIDCSVFLCLFSLLEAFFIVLDFLLGFNAK